MGIGEYAGTVNNFEPGGGCHRTLSCAYGLDSKTISPPSNPIELSVTLCDIVELDKSTAMILPFVPGTCNSELSGHVTRNRAQEIVLSINARKQT